MDGVPTRRHKGENVGKWEGKPMKKAINEIMRKFW